MRAPLSVLATLVLVLAHACGGAPGGGAAPDGGPVTPDAAPGTDAGASDAGPQPDEETLTFGPDPLSPGDERTVCVVLEAGNDVARQVRAIRTALPQGSHHMIVYRTTQAVNPTPTPCFPFAEGGEAIFVAQMDGASLVYPPDAGLRFAARQHVRLEIHEVGYLPTPVDVTASVTFEFYPLEEPPRSEVEFLFTGDMSISLPPRESRTIRSLHAAPTGARIFALTSHTHQLGTYASIHRATSISTPTELLHESRSWAEPPLTTFAPPLELGPSEGLLLTCEFTNTTDRTVSFGLDFDDEMCFLWAYYYF